MRYPKWPAPALILVVGLTACGTPALPAPLLEPTQAISLSGNLVIDGVDGRTDPSGFKTYTLGQINGMVIVRNSQNIVIRGENTSKPYSCVIDPSNPNLPGITFYNVQGLTIENCEVRNNKQGIWAESLRSGVYASSSDITVRNNWFHSSQADAMQFKRYPGHYDGVNFDRVQILDNEISAWGQGSKDDFLFHGVYMKADDALIEGNYFHDGWGGDAITIRTAGTVRGNVISDPNDVGGISYYAQVDSRNSSGELLIENNVVYTTATSDTTRRAVATATLNLGALGGDPNSRFEYLVPNIEVRFNTFVVTNPDGLPITKTIYVDPNMAAPGMTNDVAIYGNLLLDTRRQKNFTFGTGDGSPSYVDFYAFNAQRTDTTGLVTSAADPRMQYRLTAAADDLINQIRRGQLVSSGYRPPTTDIDGQRRTGLLDYGADEFYRTK